MEHLLGIYLSIAAIIWRSKETFKHSFNRFLKEKKTLNTNNVIESIDFDCALGHKHYYYNS